MDVEPASASLMLFAAALLVALVAASEVALSATPRSQIRELSEKGVERAKRLDTMFNHPAQFLSAFMFMKSASYLFAGAAVFWLAATQNWTGLWSLLALVLVWFGIVLIQVVFRALALRNPLHVALLVAPTIQFFSSLFLPLSFPLHWIGVQASGETPAKPFENIFLSEDGLRFLLDVGESEGQIEEEEKQMIASIFELGERAVREIMVPRLDVVAVEASTPIAEALDLIIQKGHSRIPVYDENIDHITGFLYAKDLLRCFRDKQTDMTIQQILRKAYFVPQSKKLDELFHDMQLRRVHVAIVVDEYGGTAGLVTIEDLLEEIVGEIQDEYDAEEPVFQQLDPTSFLFNARIDLDKVSSLIELDLTQENENVDTLGGFVYSQLGRVPEQGNTLEYQGRRFTVISIDSRRIEQVRVDWVQPVEGTSTFVNGASRPVEKQETQDGHFLRYTS